MCTKYPKIRAEFIKRKARLKTMYKKYLYLHRSENSQQNSQSIISAGRNDPCPCGSGKKFKKCCGKKI